MRTAEHDRYLTADIEIRRLFYQWRAQAGPLHIHFSTKALARLHTAKTLIEKTYISKN